MSKTNDNNSSEKPVFYLYFTEEREEILRHKWCLSEKAGEDVGFEKALTDWVLNHRQAWKTERRRHRLRANA